MKYFSNLLAIAIMFLAITSAQAQQANPNFIYTIHVGAFDKAQLSDFDDIQSVGYIYAYPLRDDLMQIFLGGYDSKNMAKQTLPKVKELGYPDAYIMRRAFDEGELVATVQIDTKQVGDQLNYGKYLQAGKIYISQINQEIRILAGQYSSESTAKKRAGQLKKMGFIDAQGRNVNTIELIEVTDFETGGATADPIVAVAVDTPKGGEPEAKKEEEIPQAYDVLFKKTTNKPKGGASKPKPKTKIPDDIPDSYEGKTTRIKVPVKKEKKSSLPKIRVKVKRTSAIELQKVLKAESAYKGSLDGYYGKGTAAGYASIKKQNQQVKKYLMLSKMMEEEEVSGENSSRLQKIINNLLDTPSDANDLLKAERSVLAKVYRAYILFENKGANAETNQLMNAAIQETFKGKKLKNTPPFDYKSKYAYDDLTQLLKHLGYIHSASDEANVPCWMFVQHEKEAASALANLRTSSCGGDFLDWEETRLLKAIAMDLDPKFGSDEEKQAAYASKRANLFVAPEKLKGKEVKAALHWHKTLWLAMENWGNSDPIHDQRVTALKVAYFQSQVRLEDYFMNKGFNYREAKPLAMSVLETIVGTHFTNYLNE